MNFFVNSLQVYSLSHTHICNKYNYKDINICSFVHSLKDSIKKTPTMYSFSGNEGFEFRYCFN